VALPFLNFWKYFQGVFLPRFDDFWCNYGARKLTIIRKAPMLLALFSKMVGTVEKIRIFWNQKNIRCFLMF
jgi:hypothetical protein